MTASKWAIASLIIGMTIVVFFVLAWLGAFSVTPTTGETCFLSEGFGCVDQQGSSETGEIKVRIISNLGENLTVTNLSIDSPSVDSYEITECPIPCYWEDYTVKDFVFKSELEKGKRVALIFSILYVTTNSEEEKTANADVTVRVI